MFSDKLVFTRAVKISLLLAVLVPVFLSASASATQDTSVDIRSKLTPCKVRGIGQEVLCGKYEVFDAGTFCRFERGQVRKTFEI